MSIFAKILENLDADPELDIVVEVQGPKLVGMKAKDLKLQIQRARTALRDAGVKAGGRVGLLSPNRNNWVAADLAVLSEGAILVPLYDRQEPKELAAMLHDCGSQLSLCFNDALATGLKNAWAELFPEETHRVIQFAELFKAEPCEEPASLAGEGETVTIIYTSGTSGEPKGVVLNGANCTHMVPCTVGALKELYGEREHHDRVFHYLPFCFAGSRIVLWTQLYRGNPIMMSTDLENLKQEMATADPNYYLNVPTLLERVRRGVREAMNGKPWPVRALYNWGQAAYERKRLGQAGGLDGLALALSSSLFSSVKKKIGPQLEFLICGSAPLSEETQAWFEMLGIPVYQVYGLTETTAIVTMDKPGKIEAGRVGYAIDGVEMKVDDEGELWVKGPNIFQEYWAKPEKTSEALKDGWFATGDLAEVDDKGNWKIIGRAKHLIVPESGHNIAPEPLEQVLKEACEKIEQAMVVGHARRYLTVIIHGPASDEELQAALDRMNEDLPHYRRLRKFLRAKEAFSPENGLLTANQKMRRRVIEAHFKEQLEDLYKS